MLKRKKVSRTILAFIATICFSIGPFVSFAKANTYTYVYSSNGIKGNAAGARDVEANYYVYNTTSTYYRTVIDVSWECNITGTFTLSLANSSSTADTVLCDGCVINSYVSTTLIQFKCTDVNHCKIEFYTISDQRGVANFYGTWNQATDLDTINTTLGQIKGYVDGVETSLGNIYTRLGTINTTIAAGNTILDKIANLYKLRDSVDIPIYSRFAYINLLRFGELSDQYNYPWSNSHYGICPTIWTNNYSAPAYNSDYDIVIPAGKTLHFIYTISYWANIFNFIDLHSNIINPTVVVIEGNNYYRSFDVSYTNNSNSDLWVNLAMNTNVNRPVIPLYLGLNVPADVAMLFNMDFENTYTRLLQSINSGISALQSDQTVIDNSTTVTNNFNTEITKVNNIELNVLSGFDNKLNTVNSAITNSGILTDNINSVPKQWAEFYLGKVFDNLVVVKYPVYIILIGFVLLCLLG